MRKQVVELIAAFESLPLSDQQLFISELGRRLDRQELSNAFEQALPIIAHAIGVFGDKSKAAHWLTMPLLIFENRSPAALIQEPGGRERVEATLGRIEHNLPS